MYRTHVAPFVAGIRRSRLKSQVAQNGIHIGQEEMPSISQAKNNARQ